MTGYKKRRIERRGGKKPEKRRVQPPRIRTGAGGGRKAGNEREREGKDSIKLLDREMEKYSGTMKRKEKGEDYGSGGGALSRKQSRGNERLWEGNK